MSKTCNFKKKLKQNNSNGISLIIRIFTVNRKMFLKKSLLMCLTSNFESYLKEIIYIFYIYDLRF